MADRKIRENDKIAERRKVRAAHTGFCRLASSALEWTIFGGAVLNCVKATDTDFNVNKFWELSYSAGSADR